MEFLKKLASPFVTAYKLLAGIRFRYIFMWVFTTLTIGALIVTDPDGQFIKDLPFGVQTVSSIVILAQCSLILVFYYIARCGLYDYMRLWSFFSKALETPMSAAIALVAFALLQFPIAWLIIAGLQKW